MKKPNDKAITAAKIVAGVAAALTLGANLTGCVYGPPPDYTSKEQTTASESKETTDPSKNQNEDVYGPPSDFTTEENELVPVYGPPSDFETESNELPDVYGPPGDMG
ncbi:MAG: hypothetical protein IKG93_02175 [Clostridiales bacterium]|nr:hypothetical protein [Clostridiales bacterium]